MPIPNCNIERLRILHPNTASRLRLLPVMHGLIGILFFFNAIGIYRSPQPNWLLVIFFLTAGIGCMLFPFIIKRVKALTGINLMARLLEVLICLTSSLYFLLHRQPVTGMLLLITGIGLAYVSRLEYQIFQPCYVTLDKAGIILPNTFSTKLIAWYELNNVILRNDLLTIDFKSNKILQLEILDETGVAQQEILNTFFQQCIYNK